MRYPPPGRLIDVGGFRLHLHAAGDRAPAVVFDAALGGSSISWARVQPEVARFARTLSYDRAGFAWSDAGPFPRTAGRIADELRVLLDRAGERPPFVLVGHSFGGLVMQIFATRFAQDTAGLVLVDPAHAEDWVTPAPKEQERIDRGVRLCGQGARAARLGVARLVSGLVGAGALTPAWAVARWFTGGELGAADDWVLSPLLKLPPEARAPLRHFWTQAKFYEALGSQIASMPESSRETLHAVRGGFGDLPLVTISSTDPGDYRLRQQDALAAASTRGRHIVAPGSSHWIPLDEPEVVVAAIREIRPS